MGSWRQQNRLGGDARTAPEVQSSRAGPAGGSTCSNLAPPEGKDFRLVPDNEYIDLGLNESLEEMWTMPSSQRK